VSTLSVPTIAGPSKGTIEDADGPERREFVGTARGAVGREERVGGDDDATVGDTLEGNGVGAETVVVLEGAGGPCGEVAAGVSREVETRDELDVDVASAVVANSEGAEDDVRAVDCCSNDVIVCATRVGMFRGREGGAEAALVGAEGAVEFGEEDGGCWRIVKNGTFMWTGAGDDVVEVGVAVEAEADKEEEDEEEGVDSGAGDVAVSCWTTWMTCITPPSGRVVMWL